MKEVAEYLGCSVVTAQRFKNEGLLPYVQKGRKVLFDKVELMKCIRLPKKNHNKAE
jgi:excisionase family DNA binding protein